MKPELRNMGRWLPALLVAGLGTARAAPGDNCVECHSPDEEAFKKSAHAKMEGGMGAACVSCHADIKATADGHPKPKEVDCNRCHAKQKDMMASSIHGENGVSCQQCHAVHFVTKPTKENHKELALKGCGQCHEDVVKVYTTSLHGKSASAQVATCTDCHGAHDITKPTDPRSRMHTLHRATTCAVCHTDSKRKDLTPESVKAVKDYFSSAHGVAVTRSGLALSATCVDCHGAHQVEKAGSDGTPLERSRIPQTCGKCHQGVLQTYMESAHGIPFKEGNTDVPVCTDCHRSHQIASHYEQKSSVYATNISNTCLRCHANAALVGKYNFPGLRAETYAESYHGAASKLGDPNVANCSSCHTAHDIRKSTDPKSSVHSTNMAATCGKCHTTDDPSRPMAMGKIHVTLAEEMHWLVKLVERFYMLMITGTMGFFCFYMVIDFRRLRSKHKKHAAKT